MISITQDKNICKSQRLTLYRKKCYEVRWCGITQSINRCLLNRAHSETFQDSEKLILFIIFLWLKMTHIHFSFLFNLESFSKISRFHSLRDISCLPLCTLNATFCALHFPQSVWDIRWGKYSFQIQSSIEWNLLTIFILIRSSRTGFNPRLTQCLFKNPIHPGQPEKIWPPWALKTARTQLSRPEGISQIDFLLVLLPIQTASIRDVLHSKVPFQPCTTLQRNCKTCCDRSSSAINILARFECLQEWWTSR